MSDAERQRGVANSDAPRECVPGLEADESQPAQRPTEASRTVSARFKIQAIDGYSEIFIINPIQSISSVVFAFLNLPRVVYCRLWGNLDSYGTGSSSSWSDPGWKLMTFLSSEIFARSL